MAGYSTSQRRVNRRADREIVQYRVDGTAAYAPRTLTPKGRTAPDISADVRRNRTKALSTGRAYVVFLAVIAVATVFMCVRYLQLKSTITAQVAANEKLESRLVSLRSENDALLENVNNGVDWNHIKDVAIDKLGMKYATEDQIVWYNSDDSYFVTQYCDVPAS